MSIDDDPMLETDHLEQLLETPPPAPAQPVVIVEYRNRGVPSWVFVPLLFVVPLGALVVYHRTVVERYRVQAAEERSLLVRDSARDGGPELLVRKDPAPTVYVFEALQAASPSVGVASRLSPGGSPAPSATAGGISGGAAAPAQADAPATPVLPAPVQTANTAAAGPAQGSAPVATRSVPVAPSRAPAVPLPDRPAAAQDVAPVVTPENPPAAPEKPIALKTRTLLPNPFANGADPPSPPAPREDAEPALDAKMTEKVPTARTQDAVPVDGPAFAEQPVKPLPTKEEALRAIEEEAARKLAEINMQLAGKSADMRAQQLAEQIKFRQELREVIKTQGNKGGPDIEALAKRYGYQSDPARWMQANYVWRYTRRKQEEKVRVIRSLELPETVILGFLYDDIFPTFMTRGGPQTLSEVHVRAARQLLRYPDPGPIPAVRPAARAGAGGLPARSQSTRRAPVFSNPR